jgi:hypothetical protein
MAFIGWNPKRAQNYYIELFLQPLQEGIEHIYPNYMKAI